jgi:peptidoglycan-associated lipoprotein
LNVSRPALFLAVLAAATLAVAASAAAQQKMPVDVSISYIAEHANAVGSNGNFWLQGGSAELGADLWRGLGVGVNVTGTHTNSFGPNAIPLTLTTATFGPRYRYYAPFTHRDLSLYGEALVGFGYGGGSIFPSTNGVAGGASSLATQIGGGIDLGLSPHIALRVVQASWVRTQLPNSTTNVQNNLSLGIGLVVKF